MATTPFIIDAGPHERRHTPVSIALPAGVATGVLRTADDGKAVPAQVHDGSVHFVIDRLKADQRRAYVFDSDAQPSRSAGVRLAHDEAARRIDIRVGRSPFTSYCYDPRFARPHFYPFLGPGGAAMTRHYPMRDDVPGEPHDHPHHRSLWVAFGDINGQDNWSEQDGHAWQAHDAMREVTAGPVFGQFTQTLRWLDHDRQSAHLHETRTVRVWKTPDSARLMDLTVALTAGDRDAVFGDTKEGGICSVRVATTMDGNKGGRIENSFGGIGEAETWGKPAHWCDYSGPVAGKVVGIAVMDHPMNLRHPTPWHVRNYGLMGANPFGHAHYKSSLLRDGSYTLPAGETLTFRYRVYLHSYDARKGGVAARYADYVAPPRVVDV